MHEQRTGPAFGGHTPQAAARDLRGILASSGGGAATISSFGISAQIEALIRWARPAGFLDPDRYLTPSRLGGLEHRIWYDAASNRVIKTTLPGQYGRSARVSPLADQLQVPHQALRLGPATPLEYLDRMSLHNEIFGDDVRVLGVIQDEGWHCLAISQPFLRGPRPTALQVNALLCEEGFHQVGEEPAYLRPTDRVALFDAHPGNFVLTQDGPVPFDLIPQRVDGHLAELLAYWTGQ